MRRLTLLVTAVLAFGVVRGGTFPLESLEAEHATRLDGSARLTRVDGASRLQCIELSGEKARAALIVRIARGGPYQFWVRALNVDGKPASITATHEGVPPVKGAVASRDWAWTRLGVLPVKRGSQALALTVTGSVLIHQLYFVGDPNLVR